MFLLLSDIVDAVDLPCSPLKSLSEVSFEREADGSLCYNVGNVAVVFRVVWRGERWALRCYRRRRAYLREIYGEYFFEAEMEVRGESLDVVLTPWVEGRSLSSVVESGEGDFEALSQAFDRLSIEMLSREGWAHGDLSADNLIVTADGSMRYIDCDANFVEALRGERSLELGTPAYQSSLRRYNNFDETIDHFSIALISVSLRAMALDSQLPLRYPFIDGLLIDGARCGDERYEVLEAVKELFAERGDFVGYRLAKILGYRSLRIEHLSEILQSRHNPTVESGDLCSFSDGLAWGYSSQTDQIVIPALFDEVFEFRDEEALVRVGAWWWYIDRSGRGVERCEVSDGSDGRKPPVRRRCKINYRLR